MSTGVEGITYICLGGASGKDQDLFIWGEISDSSCCQNSVDTREPAAEYRNIGSPIQNVAQGFRTIPDLGNELPRRPRFNDSSETGSNNRIPVCDQYVCATHLLITMKHRRPFAYFERGLRQIHSHFPSDLDCECCGRLVVSARCCASSRARSRPTSSASFSGRGSLSTELKCSRIAGTRNDAADPFSMAGSACAPMHFVGTKSLGTRGLCRGSWVMEWFAWPVMRQPNLKHRYSKSFFRRPHKMPHQLWGASSGSLAGGASRASFLGREGLVHSYGEAQPGPAK